ncbi:hypothetical protein [Aquisphaera insulae]|uniref:hypothetical protein n=1 Tax=Aquisphaera insulae TaxID=2712864 RepID=UPI0013EBAEC5|nr:hypothetical protein [Aquisphaera insulae]
MDEPRRPRVQFSLGMLMVATAVVAALLAPLAWVARERRQMLRAQVAILDAREAAIRSVARERQARMTEPERLRQDNEALRRQVEQLRLENDELRRAANRPAPR